MLSNKIMSVSIGLKRRWKSAFTQAFGLIGIIWTMTEILTKIKPFDNWVDEHGHSYAAVLIVCWVARFVSYIYEPRSVSFSIPTTDSQITIKFDDLFKQETDWVIGVNEFFDSSVGHVVSQYSLHGQFIARVFNGDEARFREAVDNALTAFQGEPTNRSIQPEVRYPIGTTIVLQNGSHKAFLVAMAQTNLQTARASSTVSLLWIALLGVLREVDNHGNGATVSIPLLGNGRSSVNIEPQHLMRLIVLALVDFARKCGLPKQINIVAHENCFKALDLREIKRDWSKR